MVTLGVIGALEAEIALIKRKMEVVSVKRVIDADFTIGKMSGKSVVIVQSRMGLVNAAICTQVLIDIFGVDYVICMGCAGAGDDGLTFGDIVISSDFMQHDFDTTGDGQPPGVNASLPVSVFQADEKLVAAASEASALLENQKTVVGRIVSGDQFICGKEAKSFIVKHFNPCCIDMESSAVAQTCYLNKVPCAAIRCVSDKADDEAKGDFGRHFKTTVENSTIIVEEIIKRI